MMKKIRLNSISSGLVFSILLSIILLVTVFHKTVFNLNQCYFSPEGDGMQSYYTAWYHAKFDKSYHYFGGMNYPYHELVLYSGCQPIISNTIHFISKNLVDISNYTVGILNFTILFSIVAGVLFLYLIFVRLKLPGIYSAFISVLICFASPQLVRISAHYSLAYLFFIPLLIYLLIMFQQTGKYRLFSFLIFLSTLLAAFTHIYFLSFYGIILLIFWIYFFINRNFIPLAKNMFAVVHIIIQLILPVIILQLYSIFLDPVSDRTSRPYGFMDYRAFPESVLLPLFQPYGNFLKPLFASLNYIGFEGKSYAGLVAVIIFIILLIKSLVHVFKLNFKKAFRVTDNNFLNLIFWAGFVALLYSFGFPFFLNLENLINYIGPLKQLRAIGRFAWVFYYSINIVAFYQLWQYTRRFTAKNLKILLLVLPVLILFIDAWFNFHGLGNLIHNKRTELSDFHNSTEMNRWVKKLDVQKYQAIIPLPYFHIGSENIGLEPVNRVFYNTCYVSLKTGLPTTGAMLSRTSVSQSLKNTALFFGPCIRPAVLDDLPCKKPFLVVCQPTDSMNETMKYLLSQSEFLEKTSHFNLYELPYAVLEHISDSVSYISFRHKNIILKSDESVSEFMINSKNTLILDTDIPVIKNGETVEMGFWYSNIYDDLNLRTWITFLISGQDGKEIKKEDILAEKILKTINADWGYLEYSLSGIEKNCHVRVFMKNDCIVNRHIEIKGLTLQIPDPYLR